jgi:plasmid maintenance system antidote protein VapI
VQCGAAKREIGRNLKPMGIGQVEAARRLDISLNRLNEIVLGKRGITADTARVPVLYLILKL